MPTYTEISDRLRQLSIRSYMIGMLIALYVLSGRWSFARIFSDKFTDLSAPFYYELRFWIVLLLCACALFVRKPIADKESHYVRYYLLLLYFFFTYTLLSSIWAPDIEMALGKGYEVVLVIVATFSIYILLSGREGGLVFEQFWKIIFLLTAVLAAIAIYKVRGIDAERLAVLGGGPNVFGRMMGLLCLTSLYYWSRGGRLLVWLPPVVIAFCLVILSGSRGSLVAICLAIAVYIIVSRVSVTKVILFAIAALLLSSILISFTTVGQKVMDSYEVRVANLLIEQRYTAGRGNLYQAAMTLGSKNPFIGAGLAAFPANGLGVYPHNIFLEAFCEGGGTGFVLLIIPMSIFIYFCWACRLVINPLPVAACILILAASQFSGDYFDSRTIFTFMLMAFLSTANSAKVGMQKVYQERFAKV